MPPGKLMNKDVYLRKRNGKVAVRSSSSLSPTGIFLFGDKIKDVDRKGHKITFVSISAPVISLVFENAPLDLFLEYIFF